jgi:small redox-active disulfide protein 2
MHIKIMGPGCHNCQKVAKLVQESAVAAGVDVQVEKVTDFQEMAKAGVFSTPAVVIDGTVKCVGKVPSKEEILGWLK